MLDAKGITQDQLARAMAVSRLSVNQLVNGKRSITADMALRLARVLGTTEEFWFNLQRDYDLSEARRALGSKLDALTVLRKPEEAA
ncbi:MAG TPA: HigA family addiction module antitoxin [Rhizomicrobium sp.]|nr:HigA family addiction module antitoxin [Rhizomicrobium sp.]